MSSYIGRIQKAGALLHSSANRIRELEDALYDVQRRNAEVSAQLQVSEARCAELEQAVAQEVHRAKEAETHATVAEEASTRLQQALASTSGNLNALTSTIESIFPAGPEVAATRNAA